MISPTTPSPLDLWNEPLAADEREHLLSTLTEMVAKRGLQTPVLLALEINRPLAFVASQGVIATAPFLAPLFGLDKVQGVGRLLQDPDAINDLIDRIAATETAGIEKTPKGATP